MSKNLVGVLIKSALGLVGVLVLMVAAAILAAYLETRGIVSEGHAFLWVMSVFAVALMVGAFWVGLAWMRSIDEAAREAHKSAWYWGGTAGMAVGGVGVILATLPQAESLSFAAFEGRTDPAAYMAAGAMGMMLLMLVGYSIAWDVWWLARR